MSERVSPGLVLADSQIEAEANAYLQRRLIVFYGFTVAIAAVMYIVSGALQVMMEGWTGALLFRADRVVHVAAVVLSLAVLRALRHCPFGTRALIFLDALGLYIAVGAILLIYAIIYTKGPQSMAGTLALFVVARAVVVPCSPKTTFFLSLPAPIGFLAVQLSYGTYYFQDGVELERGLAEMMIWQQVVLFTGIWIATLASWVNFGLRHQVREAQRLGQYRIERRLGRGAMGEVFLAKHATLRRPTAIKLITPDATDPETLERFELEVRQTSRLTHPNTVSIFDYGHTPDGTFYYAMEYLDGADLDRIVRESGPMPPARVIHLLTQACGALKEAHDAGLVHRDIKASNIIACRQGGEHDVVKVVDFGLVKDLRAVSPSLTQVGQICGTPETLAPEILKGETPTPAADLYSLGVVGYFLLTGTPVFDAGSAAEFIGHHMHTLPPPLLERDPSLPGDLVAAIHRCLEKKPGDRPADAAELRAMLRRCADAGRWTETNAAAWWREREAA